MYSPHPDQAVQASQRTFELFPKLPVEIRLMIWEATFEPRIVHLQEFALKTCHHQLRRVRSDTLVPDTCRDDPDREGKTTCDPKYDLWHPQDIRRGLKTRDIDEQIQEAAWDLRDAYPHVKLRSYAPIPTVLHACQESRRIASQSYIPSFATLGAQAQVYFNFEIDTIYLDRGSSLVDEGYWDYDFMHSALTHFCSVERPKIQSIAFNIDTYEEPLWKESDISRLCDLLERCGNVKIMTSVVGLTGNFKEDTSSTSLELSTLVFHDPISIRRKIYMFDFPEYHDDHSESGSDHRLPAKANWNPIPEKEIRTCRQNLNFPWSSKGKPKWPVPILQRRSITTVATVNYLRRRQLQYESEHDCRCYLDAKSCGCTHWEEICEYEGRIPSDSEDDEGL